LDALGIRVVDLRVDADLKSPGPSPEDRIRYARSLWESSRPIAGTIAEKYLREARGITSALPRSLRSFPLLKHREYVWPFPCLCAGIQAPDGTFVGVSVAWLCADATDKAPVDPPRKVFGVLNCGSVRLARADEIVVICEGVETGLSLAQACPELSVWCALSASNLARVEIPKAVRTVIIAADNDERGEQAAQAAARKFFTEGVDVKIARPLGAKDFNGMTL
jgi:hypothetical protein